MTAPLTSSEWEGRSFSLEQDIQNSGSDSGELMAQMIAALGDHSDDLTQLNSAVSTLKRLGPAVQEHLEPLTRHPSAEVRQACASILGELGSKDAVDPLIRLLHDADPNVVYHAIEALGITRSIRALPELLKKAGSEDFFLSFPAVEALGRIGEPCVYPELFRWKDDPTLRDPAHLALSRLGHRIVVPDLVSELETPGADHGQLIHAICSIDRRYREVFQDSEVVPALFVSSLTSVGAAPLLRPDSLLRAAGSKSPWDDVCTCLSWIIDSAHPCREDAVGTLVDLLVIPGAGDRASREIANLALPAELLDPALAHWDPGVRARAAKALTANVGEGVVQRLIKLLDDGESEVSRQAALTLSTLANEDGAAAVIQRLLHTTPKHRRVLLASISRLSGVSDSDARLLQNHDDPAMRVLGIRSSTKPQGSALFERLKTETDTRVVAALLDALTANSEGSAELTRFLEATWMKSQPGRQSAIARVVHSLFEAGNLHKKCLESEELWTRLYACRAALKRASLRANIDLDALALDPLPPVRSVAAALAPHFGPHGLTVLDRLCNDSEDDVVDAAIAAIAKYPRDEALPRMLKIGESGSEVHRRSLIVAASAFEDDSTLTLIRQALDNPGLQNAALTALWEKPGDGSLKRRVQQLMRAKVNDPEPLVRRGILLALADLRTESEQLLALFQDDPDAGVQLILGRLKAQT